MSPRPHQKIKQQKKKVIRGEKKPKIHSPDNGTYVSIAIKLSWPLSYGQPTCPPPRVKKQTKKTTYKQISSVSGGWEWEEEASGREGHSET